MYVLNFLLYQRLNYSFGPSTISCVNVIPQVSKSNRWWGGCASVVYSLGMGPKGHVLMRFHIIKKKKKNKPISSLGTLSLKILMELFDNDVDERSYEVCICL